MRKPKKEYPPGTFIPTPKRILSIIQLCLAFSLFLWYSTQPFMGEYFNLKSRMLAYEYVMGTSDFLKSDDQQEKMRNNTIRFALLEKKDKEDLQEHYQNLQTYSNRPVLIKMKDGLLAVLWRTPAFELAWIIFTIILSILILKKVKGAKTAAWLLPVIVLAYGIDNQLTGKNPIVPLDAGLFPSESVIIKDYLKEPLSANVSKQQKQLKTGWEDYLIANWTKKNESLSRDKGLEEAEFNFTLGRIKALQNDGSIWTSSFHQKSNVLLLGLYFLWNVFFAWMINKRENAPKAIQET